MTKMRQTTVLAAVAVVAVLVGGWFLLVSPQRSKAADLHDQAATQLSNNEQLRNELVGLKSQHRDLPKVQAELAKLAAQMPNNPALPQLIRALSSAADSAGVDLFSLQPSPPQFVVAAQTLPVAPPADASASTDTSSTATSGASAPAAAPVASGTAQLAYIPLVVTVNGGYFQVEQFVSNLEALKRSFLVSGITMTPGKSGDASSPSLSTAPTGGAPAYTGSLQAVINARVFMTAQPPAPATLSPTTTDTSAASSATTTP